MNFKLLLKATGVALLSAVALADDCKEIKSYIQSSGKSYSKNIENCEVDSNGKVKTLSIKNISLNDYDISKITSYSTIENIKYQWGVIEDDDSKDGYQTTQLKDFPSALSKLTNLKELSLIYYGINESDKATIDDDVLKASKNLKKLTLNGIQLSQTNVSDIAKLTNLQEINWYRVPENFNLDALKKGTTTTTTTKKTTTTPSTVPVSTDGRCGKDAGKCPEDECCSKYGWCGTEEGHCSVEKGCQSEFGRCNSSPTTKKTTTTTTTTKKTTTTPSTVPVSTNGRCGKDAGKCPKDECCSQYGWCGTEEGHCSVEKGCQSEFGRCNSSTTTKKSSTTKKISTTTKKTTTTTTSTKKTTTTPSTIPTSTNGKCGKGIGKCPKDECCSKYGWCGTEEGYCSVEKGCQSEFGRCNSSSTTKKSTTIKKTITTKKTTTKKTPTKKTTTKKTTTKKSTATATTTKKTATTPSTVPVSTNGRCGKGVGKCPKDECCSQYGWCGTEENHCSISKGCQSEFGKCK